MTRRGSPELVTFPGALHLFSKTPPSFLDERVSTMRDDLTEVGIAPQAMAQECAHTAISAF
eukprot:CAMPEP_0172577230 /NCGR_PEP_ID=MMETSP1067-20121228/138128_1 /TAXON_ID=265564 ORGANISM="Thalassiosira punctigera, Strain Tpunct2005C2" /NCGR_SAMPLE_ID=MMETSP1067 /ASSEMBLY_ACC=CAM_ASM_000444 /LENGTH=60 /DNA_ID=CAMNT_0013369915 /DNA_START=629 /DNA_END=811 /DNA_ORIENTATION=+